MNTRQVTLTNHWRGFPLQAEGFLRYLFKLFSLLATPALIGAVALAILQSFALLFLQDISQLKINLILQLVVLIVFACWSLKRSGTYLNAPFIFVFAIWFWHSPFLTGHYLGLGGDFDYIGNRFRYGYFYVPKASALVTLCLCFSILGSLCAFVQQRQRVIRYKRFAQNCLGLKIINLKIHSNKYFKKSTTELAWLTFLGFGLVLFTYFIFEGIKTFGNTYMSLYTNHPDSLLYRFYQSTKFYGVVVILAMFASIKNKKAFIVAAALTAGLISINILLGSRSVPFIYALALLISIDCFIKKVAVWQLIVVVVAASAISFIIDQTRLYGLGLQILNLGQTGRSIDFLHIFWNSGGTIMCVLRTMEFSSKSGFLFGKSIADAIIYLIPRAIVDGFGFKTGFTTPSVWLVEKSADIPVGGGLGYSLVAEAYLNFGMLGCVLFAFIGWFIAKHFYSYIFHKDRFGALHAFNVAIIFSLHMRNDMGTYLRALFYGFIYIEILRIMQTKTFFRRIFKFDHTKDAN